MSSQLRTLPWVLAIVTVSSIGLSAQAPERLIGTWTINLAKSKYSPADLAPKSGTTRFEAVQGGMRLVADGIDWKGRTTHTDYVVKFDGQVVPTNGTVDGKPNPDQDGAAWRKIDDYTYEITNTLKGKPLTTIRVVIARDGKTRTLTYSGKNAQGQTINNTVLSEKQ